MSWGQLYLDCWNRRSPLELAALFAPDCRYEEVGTGSTFEGHEGLRRRITFIERGLADAHFTLVSGFTNFDRYSLEWVVTATAAGRPLVRKATSVGVLDGWGRIQLNRDYGVELAALTAATPEARAERPLCPGSPVPGG